MSTTDVKISKERLGRMIRALQLDCQRKTKGAGYRYYYRVTVSNDRRHTDAQIQKALKLTDKQFKEALAAWRNTQPRTWTLDMMADKLIAFAKKHERWPTSREYRKENREHDIPPASSMQGWGGQDNVIRRIIEKPSLFRQLTPQLILGIRNITTRRAAMDKYGIEKLLRKGGGVEIQEDDFGKLWRLPTDNFQDAHVNYVEVVNSTPEPDGTYAHYFIRVPPEINTAKAGVEWSFEEEKMVKFKVQT